MKILLIHIAALLLGAGVFAQSPVRLTPYIQQPGIYYVSEHVTFAGGGFGAGLLVSYKKHLFAQCDMNVCWANGNALSTRIAVGYKKSGLWAPAVMANLAVLYGSRTEVLMEDGRSPSQPITAVGLRIAPLRFENEKGFISLLEFGYGFGKYKGSCIDGSLIAIGIRVK